MSISRRREVLDAIGEWVALARLEQDASMREPAGLQVVPSQESQP